MFIPIGDNIERRTIPIVPFLLIIANVMVFLLEMRIACEDQYSGAGISEFMSTWGLVPNDLAQGRLTGLLTHMFLHGGFMHIIGNMVVLWAFSVSLEEGLGKWTLAGFYVLFGVVGGLAHAATNWSDDIPLVGASGAIAGLIGAYTVLYGPMSKIRMALFLGFQPLIFNVPAALFGFGWFMMQVYEAGSDPEGTSGVAWYAHIGGFLAGAVTMYICRGDVACEVKQGSHGYLEFEQKVQPQSTAAAPVESALAEEYAFSELPSTCPYCDAALGDEHRQGDNLVRCGNDECGRLIFLEAAACAPTA